MINREKRIPSQGIMLSFLTGINILIIEAGYTTGKNWYWALVVTIPALVLAILNTRQK